MAEVEVAASDIAPDAFLSEEGFTVEAWVAALAEELHPLPHANPLISRHGPASGWELRLCATGAVVFLVTIDGKHWELESPSCCEWRGQWIHVAGTFDGVLSRVFVGKEMQGELQVAPSKGTRVAFEGPLCLGRNPAWKDRGARCWLHAARVARSVVAESAFLPAPKVHGSSFI